MYMQRTTSGAAGIGMGTTIKHLRRTTSGAAGNGLGETMKYLRRTTSAAANKDLRTTINPPCSAASFEVNSEPHTGASPSVRLCVGPELARCIHQLRRSSIFRAYSSTRAPVGAQCYQTSFIAANRVLTLPFGHFPRSRR